jgi:hypothetical protein
MLAKVKSKLGNTCANVFTNGKFTTAIPMTSRADAGKSLIDFTDDVGIPEALVTDGAGEFTGKNTEFIKEARRMRIKLYNSESGRHNQNHAEREIMNLGKRWRLRMTKKQVPKRLWDFGLVYESEILSRMSRGQDGRTGYEEVTGNTPEIGEWLDFEFYDLVWWYDRPSKPSISQDQRCLARWLGVSHRVGSDLCYWLITEAGKIIAKTSVEHVIRDDYLDPERKKAIDHFNASLERNLDDENFEIEGDGEYDSFHALLDTDVDDDYYENFGIQRDPELIPTDEEYGDMLVDERPEADDEQAIDNYLNTELMMDLGTGNERFGRVVKRARGIDGEPVGRAHSNPLFDTREYHVEFTDGTQEKYAANIIAENMYAQVDDEGRQYMIIEEIVDHKKDNTAVPISEGFTMSKNGQRRPKITTRGHQLLCKYKHQGSQFTGCLSSRLGCIPILLSGKTPCRDEGRQLACNDNEGGMNRHHWHRYNIVESIK